MAASAREARWWAGAWLVLWLAAAGPALAQCPDGGTPVSPFVLNETWTAASSPYCVTSDVFVVGLTIESNVTVKVCGNYVFEVAGRLQVNGASNAPVVFTPQDPSNGWKGILFSDAVPGSYFNHAIIEGAKQSGVRITNTPPAFTNCIIRNNTTMGTGGGVCAKVPNYQLVLQGCIITNNMAPSSGGGGIWVDGPAAFTRCVFGGNRARTGGGLSLWGSSVLTHCTIAGNSASADPFTADADGIYAVGNCSMRNCLITGNGLGGTSEGTVYFDGGTLQMANCLVATNAGGGLRLGSGSATVANCIFASNGGVAVLVNSALTAVVNCTLIANQRQGLDSGDSPTTVSNSIVYFNNAGGTQVSGAASFAYSDVQGGVRPGPGNISYNPALCSQSLALILGSPCIDAGTPDPSYNDVCLDNNFCTLAAHGTVRNDMGAFGGPGACNWLAGEAAGIFTPPQSQSSCLGQSVTFTVAATGSPPLAYQWYFNGGLLAGQTRSSLALSGLEGSNSGSYAVVVSNVFGSATSAPANLEVYDACVDLRMYAGLDIAGQAGRTYVLSYVNDLANTNWSFLATNTLGTSNWFYLDMESPFQPKRFYRVNLKP
jgi:hypothetical protein